MTATTHCPICNEQAEPEDQYCGQCGSKLQIPEPPVRDDDFIPLPTSAPPRRRRSSKPEKKRTRRFGAIVSILLIVVVAFGVKTYAAGAQEPPDQGMTVLLMGVDARPGEEIDLGVRPDSLMVLHIDANSCRILSIPRDSRVTLRDHGETKINHALALGGISYQVQTVEDFLGIEIDHYGLIDFEGLTSVVDAIGGVTVNNDLYAFTSGGSEFAEGEIELSGSEALAFSRYRGGPDGDFGRMQRQQMVIFAILTKLQDADVISTVPALILAAQGHYRTDFTVPDIVKLATEYRSGCTVETLETRSLNGSNQLLFDPVFNQDLWFVVQDPDEVAPAAQWLLTGEQH
ncbi:MAG: LCP family protein [Thermomicrobiales bacterium]|nr:LCP family protein [Thermomicrobiales bacterium]